MRFWKKRWLDELENTLPPMRQEVHDEPLPCEKNGVIKKSNAFRDWFATHKKRFFAGVATCVAAVVGVCAALPFLFPPTVEEPVKTPSALYLEINPSAVFSVDENGTIVAVVAGNADADVILSDQTRVEEIVGKTAETGVCVFVDYAARLGYLDLNTPSAVRLSGIAENELKAAVSGIEVYFREKGAYAVVVNETLSLAEFCSRTGIACASDAQSLVESVNALNRMYSKRQAEGKTDEEVQSLYGELVALEQLEEIIKIMEWLGMDTTALKALIELPQTLAEYTEKIDAYFMQTYQQLLEKYEEGYGQVRDEIAETDYEAYIESIEREYGSLSEYWNSLTNSQYSFK